MTRLTKSQPVALLGEAPPRARVVPQGVRANSWQDVADLSARAGVYLDGWQELILKSAMGERADGKWAAQLVGVTAPRQNGKTQLMLSRALAGALLFGERKIVISAHRQDSATETFTKLNEVIEDSNNAWLRARLKPGRGKGVVESQNRQGIRFTNGASIDFKTRTGPGNRGFSSDCLMLDEGQRTTQQAWTSINSTRSAMWNPQLWLLGTMPMPDDESAVFMAVRKAALEGVSSTTAWLEWGADPKSPDFDPASEYTRWTANPAWNVRINHEVVQSEYETYPAELFGIDRLGLPPASMVGSRFISAADWAATTTSTPPPNGIRSIGVAFSQDGSRLSVAGSVKHAAGVHVELIGAYSGSTEQGVAALADWLSERKAILAEIHICGPDAPVLVNALADRKVPSKQVHQVTTGEYFAACAMLVDSVREGVKTPGAFTHPKAGDGDALDASVSICDRKVRATGSWGWEATTEDGDETPTEAISVALRAAKTTKRRPGHKVRGSVS